MNLSENLVALIGHLAWPATVIVACIVFYRPLLKLIATLGKRITKLSAFKIDIELARLSQAKLLGATVESLRKIEVTESGMAPIVAGAVKSAAADYLVVDIGNDGENWLTSRLFLLAAILERSRAIRCLVFLDDAGRFVGAATTRDVRSSIGAHYLAYESAFAAAYGHLPTDQNIFRGGLNEILINALSNSFLQSSLIFKPHMPIPEIGWVEFERASPPSKAGEFADWVTAAKLKDLLGQHLLTGSIVADIGQINPQVTKALVHLSGPFVALVDGDKVFKEICDRYAVLESVARDAIAQSADSG
jgi:hypothetical protein